MDTNKILKDILTKRLGPINYHHCTKHSREKIGYYLVMISDKSLGSFVESVVVYDSEFEVALREYKFSQLLD